MVQRVKIMYFTLLTEDWNPDPKSYSRHLTTTWDSRSKRFHTLFWPPQTPTDMWHTHMQTWCTNIHINLKNSIEKAMPLSKNTVNWVKKKTYFIEIEKTRANYSLIKDGAQEFTKRNWNSMKAKVKEQHTRNEWQLLTAISSESACKDQVRRSQYCQSPEKGRLSSQWSGIYYFWDGYKEREEEGGERRERGRGSGATHTAESKSPKNV